MLALMKLLSIPQASPAAAENRGRFVSPQRIDADERMCSSRESLGGGRKGLNVEC